nr:RNA polymerase beta' subunit [Bolbitis hekouensis]WCO10219.1 RNA polymerase beta' subunit [Bolbitis hekouensis]
MAKKSLIEKEKKKKNWWRNMAPLANL